MDTNSFFDITIEDFDESDFADPISLLDALKKKAPHANKYHRIFQRHLIA